MELKPGYKQTEVGVIPEEWEVRSLGTLATMVASGRSRVGAAVGSYPVHGSTGVIGYTEKPEYEGDAILAARVGANAGRLNLVSGQYGVTDNTIMVRLSSGCCLPFFWRQLESKRLNSLVFGSGQPLITGTQLKALPLSVPPLREQRAIAAALSDVDALIGALDQVIAKKRDLKQAAMQQLLTGQKRLPGFHGEWEVKRLGDVGSFSKGRGLSKGELADSGSVPAIPYTAIYTDFAEVIAQSKIAHFINSTSNAVIINGPHLLIAGSSNMLENIGKAAAYVDNTDVAVGGDIIIYRTTADVRFLSYLLSTQPHRKRVVFLSQGSTIRHVYRSTFERYELALPSHREQTAIAEVLSDMDAELAALEQRRDKTRALKQGMMQELLTGRIRLV